MKLASPKPLVAFRRSRKVAEPSRWPVNELEAVIDGKIEGNMIGVPRRASSAAMIELE
jgi:hypothetical protein